jgi:membrane associated rhomboid family serine protease
MFPIRDDVPSRTYPVVTTGLIVINVAVFVIEISMGARGLQRFAYEHGLIPVYVTAYAQGGGVSAAQALFPFVSSVFLHGGWMHLIGNVWYLWIFGDNVEDRLGHFRFLVFFILCGVLGNLAHYAFNHMSEVPAIGASGAIAGVLGVYLISYPGARILTLIPIFFFLQFVELPALIFLGFWFILQFLNGIGSVVVSTATGGTAWWAHIGGFVGGILIFRLFRPRPKVWYRRRRRDDYEY